jgi:hypothetical protein
VGEAVGDALGAADGAADDAAAGAEEDFAAWTVCPDGGSSALSAAGGLFNGVRRPRSSEVPHSLQKASVSNTSAPQ